MTQAYETSPPVLCCDSSICKNSSDQLGLNESFGNVLSSQDDELLRVLEDLQNEKSVNNNSNCSDDTRISGYFCSCTSFSLSRMVLSENEIKVLEKGLDFAPIQNKVNEPELRKDFDEFCRRMRIKWHFRNEPLENFSTIPAFRSKSSWKPPAGHPNLEVFLSSVEKELFEDIGTSLKYSNLSTEELKAIRSLADDRSIVIKKADKGSAVVVFERNDYIKEVEKQLGDQRGYQKVNSKEKLLCELVDKSNSSFKELKRMGRISDKTLKCFTYEFKKANNLGKSYLLPKIHKRLENVPGKSIISNCGAPTEKNAEFLDFYLKSIMQNGASYINKSNKTYS